MDIFIFPVVSCLKIDVFIFIFCSYNMFLVVFIGIICLTSITSSIYVFCFLFLLLFLLFVSVFVSALFLLWFSFVFAMFTCLWHFWKTPPYKTSQLISSLVFIVHLFFLFALDIIIVFHRIMTCSNISWTDFRKWSFIFLSLFCYFW